MIWDQNFYIIFFPFCVYLGIIGALFHAHIQKFLPYVATTGLGLPLMCIPTTWNDLRVVEAWFGCAAARMLISQ